MNMNLIKTDSYMPCKAVAHMSQVEMDVLFGILGLKYTLLP